MAVADTIKRAPKWAWYTVGGVTLGAIGIRLWKGRDAPTDTETVAESDAVGNPAWQSPGGGASGVIVPPVIIPSQGDPLAGVSELQGLYVGAVDSLIGEWGNVYGPIAGLLPSLIPTPDEYMGLIQAGAGIARETPVVVAPPVAQPAPAPAPTPGPGPARLIRTCGTSYNQNGNCRYKKVQEWSDGRKVTISDAQLHKGKCGKTDTDCW